MTSWTRASCVRAGYLGRGSEPRPVVLSLNPVVSPGSPTSYRPLRDRNQRNLTSSTDTPTRSRPRKSQYPPLLPPRLTSHHQSLQPCQRVREPHKAHQPLRLLHARLRRRSLHPQSEPRRSSEGRHSKPFGRMLDALPLDRAGLRSPDRRLRGTGWGIHCLAVRGGDVMAYPPTAETFGRG